MVDIGRDMLTPQAFYLFLHFKVWNEAQKLQQHLTKTEEGH